MTRDKINSNIGNKQPTHRTITKRAKQRGGVALRPCLNCVAKFLSAGFGNRICPKCSGKPGRYSDADRSVKAPGSRRR